MHRRYKSPWFEFSRLFFFKLSIHWKIWGCLEAIERLASPRCWTQKWIKAVYNANANNATIQISQYDHTITLKWIIEEKKILCLIEPITYGLMPFSLGVAFFTGIYISSSITLLLLAACTFGGPWSCFKGWSVKAFFRLLVWRPP